MIYDHLDRPQYVTCVVSMCAQFSREIVLRDSVELHVCIKHSKYTDRRSAILRIVCLPKFTKKISIAEMSLGSERDEEYIYRFYN